MGRRKRDDHDRDNENLEVNLPEDPQENDAEVGEDEEAGLFDDQEETTDLVTVTQARNMREARTMKSILESAEITAFIGQEAKSPAECRDEDKPVHGIPILVPAEMVTEAEEILAEAAMNEEDEDFDEEDLDDEEWETEDEDEEEGLDDDSLEDFDEDEEDYDEDLEDFDEGED